MTVKGIIAAGHEKTAEAARTTLEEGGNAFDAILAAFFAACVSEPVLCSLGGRWIPDGPHGRRPQHPV